MSPLKSTRQQLVKVPGIPCLYRHSLNLGYYGIKKVGGKRKEHSLRTMDRTVVVPVDSSTGTLTGSGTVTYGYDALGRVNNRSIDSGNTVTTAFDALGRVTAVTNALTPTGSFSYGYLNETSLLTSVTAPASTGLSTSYTYFTSADPQDWERLETIQNMSGTIQLSTFGYTYKPVGTIATWTTQTGTTTAVLNTLSYDNADQLIQNIQSGGGTAGNQYNYDPAGNRLAGLTLNGTTVMATTAGVFNNLNQLVFTGTGTTTTVSGTTNIGASTLTVNGTMATISGTVNFTTPIPTLTGTGVLNVLSIMATPSNGAPTATQRFGFTQTGTAPTALSYDLNGNTTTDENGNTYTWDALNRLTKITYPSSAYTTMAYDGLSRRTQIAEYNSYHTLTSTKNYLWVGSEMAEERDGSNNVTKRFFPQGEQQSGTNYYYTRDHLGSVREMCSSTGTITSRMAYDPYGRTTTVSGTVLPTMQYAGYYQHPTSGLELTQYRAYDANTGRWLSRDPSGEDSGLNIYDYVSNCPSGAIDALGLRVHVPKPGDFDITITPNGNSANDVIITYSAPTNCKCKTIKLVQYVSQNGQPWRVDYKPGEPDSNEPYPYYQHQNGGAGNATSSDAPGLYFMIPGHPFPYVPGWLNQDFITCAFCVETGEKLGCIKWSNNVSPFGPSSSGSQQNVPGKQMAMPFTPQPGTFN